MSAPSEAEKRLQRSAAADTSWANTPDRAARMAPAWEARDARFERLVDPDGAMTPQARAQAAASARSAFYKDMSRKALAARRAKQATQRP